MLVFGVGNRYRRDDGLGPVVAERLRALGVPAVEHSGEGASLLEAMDGADLCVVVDASRSDASPGLLRRFEASAEELPRPFFSKTTHDFGLAEAVETARVLGRLPRRLVVFAVEGRDFGPGEGLSPEVEAALPDVVGAVLAEGSRKRLSVFVRGAVQGVGYRPFVFRLATELGLAGWVLNSPQGVSIQVEGSSDSLEVFLDRLEADKPPLAFVQGMEEGWLDPVGLTGFEIRESEQTGERTALALPDVATCPQCLAEIRNPADRRFRYPFTNCTNCGPRFSIIQALPYDRPNTSMRGFAMCPKCRAEYEAPTDRRFHAQPNACPVCGPRLAFWGPDGGELARREEALEMAERLLREGGVLALKGVGGFHLMVDARNDGAVQRLRKRKRREGKPLALMAPDLESVEALCEVSRAEARLLRSPEAPIVLLRRRPGAEVADSVAPGNPYLGVMLPYSPLHHLLMADLGLPVVATSGNVSDEPIATDEREALARLGAIADGFLVHDRPIVRPIDDSVARVMAGRVVLMRRARGYAPLPIPVPGAEPGLLAVGAHLKSVVALSQHGQALVSQHIGDLDTAGAVARFEETVRDLQQLTDTKLDQVVHDAHPDYASTRLARETGLPSAAVQHHVAHAYACLVDNDLRPPALAVAWDGTGYGLDGTVWGGEFIRLSDDLPEGWERVGRFLPFPLPGGDKAVREPRRSALGALVAMDGIGAFDSRREWMESVFSYDELRVLRTMLDRSVQSPLTSSVGRLFDAVSALVGLGAKMRFEGQAAMALEFAATDVEDSAAYPVDLSGLDLDWRPCLRGVLKDVEAGVPAGVVARRFHNAMVEAAVAVARSVGESRVLLTGGCFQNKLLLEGCMARLEAEGFQAYGHQRVPPNDGGIALGQVAAVAFRKGKKEQ